MDTTSALQKSPPWRAGDARSLDAARNQIFESQRRRFTRHSLAPSASSFAGSVLPPLHAIASSHHRQANVAGLPSEHRSANILVSERTSWALSSVQDTFVVSPTGRQDVPHLKATRVPSQASGLLFNRPRREDDGASAFPRPLIKQSCCQWNAMVFSAETNCVQMLIPTIEGNNSSDPPQETSTQPADRSKVKMRRIRRYCKHGHCSNYVIDRGLCVLHGGGKRCYIEDCGCRAQSYGLCWKHGGYKICTFEGCKKRAKSHSLCWAHGGGTKCKHPSGCDTIAVSRGLCWAHGGGKRCLVDGCEKPASQKLQHLCAAHFQERKSR